MTPISGFENNYNYGAVNKFDFYSGSQITVWFGNILIDDINSIQWIRQQNKKPIYGYASQQFDAMAKGTVLIQGNFIINFRQRGYLPALFDNIKDLYKHFNPNDTNSKTPYDSERWDTVRGLIHLHLKNDTFGPTTNAEIKALGDSPNFLEEAKLYEDIIWGDLDLKEQQKMTPADMSQTEIIPDGFNILVSYGDPSTYEAMTVQERLRSTAKSLNNVHIVGESQVIQVGGQPCQEQYEFIARGTDEQLST